MWFVILGFNVNIVSTWISIEKRRHQVVQEVFAKLGYDTVKPEQMMAIEAFINGIDVFVNLLTGFDKWSDYFYRSVKW